MGHTKSGQLDTGVRQSVNTDTINVVMINLRATELMSAIIVNAKIPHFLASNYCSRSWCLYRAHMLARYMTFILQNPGTLAQFTSSRPSRTFPASLIQRPWCSRNSQLPIQLKLQCICCVLLLPLPSTEMPELPRPEPEPEPRAANM